MYIHRTGSYTRNSAIVARGYGKISKNTKPTGWPSSTMKKNANEKITSFSILIHIENLWRGCAEARYYKPGLFIQCVKLGILLRAKLYGWRIKASKFSCHYNVILKPASCSL